MSRLPLLRWRQGLAYGQVKKVYKRGRVDGVEVRVVHGKTKLKHVLYLLGYKQINTSVVERHNGRSRLRNQRQVRKTLAFSKALRYHRTSLAFRARLASQDPTHVQWQRDLSVCHNKIGDMLRLLGDQAGALVSYRDDLAIAERLAAQEPSDIRRQTDLVVSYWNLAQIYAATHQDATESVALLSLGLTILRRLQSEGGLPPSQQHWLDEFEQALRTLSPSRRRGTVPRAARAVWRMLSWRWST